MRKIICFAVSIIVLINFGNAQSVQGTLLQGTASNRVIFAIQASSNFSAAITNVQFTLQIPNTFTPIPSVTISNNMLATYIPAYNNNTVNSTTPIAFTNEGGFYNYLFSATVTGGTPFNFTTSTTNVLEVEINGAQGATTVRFANLASGGSSGQHYFYVEAAGVDRTNEAAMFFGVGIVNSGSYNSYSYVPLSNATLPVQFSQFTAQCNNKGALLTWKTASEQNSNRFEIQRSTNGADWVVIDNVAAAFNSTTNRNYQYMDLKGGAAFYRIRQVDNDGRFTYTAIKATDCKNSNNDIALFPVPAKDNLNVVLKTDHVGVIEFLIIDNKGSTLRRLPIQVRKGNNNFNIVVADLPAGQFMLVSNDPAIQFRKMFTVLR